MWAAHHFWYFRVPGWGFYPVCWNRQWFAEPESLFHDDTVWDWSTFCTSWWT